MSKIFWLSFFDIHRDGGCQNFFGFRFSIFIVMANVKIFWLSFFDIHRDGGCQKFFGFRFSILVRVPKVKFLLTFVF